MMREVFHSLFIRLTAEANLIGASVFRIAVGLNILSIYLLNYVQRQYLWGPNGVWPFEEFLRNTWFSLYRFSDSLLFFETVFHLGILATILFTLGYRVRITAILNLIFLWSLHERNPWILEGGDNIIRIVLLFLLFANLGAYFGYDSQRYWQRIQQNSRPLLQSFSAVLHNFAIIAAITQLCIMYFITGFHKAMGEMWQEGVAIYYILRTRTFNWPGVSDLIIQNEWLTVLLTYLTVIFELAFPFLLFNTITRRLAILGGLVFHTAIALFMSLPTFQIFVLSVYALLIPDREYQALGRWLQMWKFAVTDRIRSLIQIIRRYPILRMQRLLVFYDGHCQLCIRSVEALQRLDFFSLLEFVSFRDPQVIVTHGLNAQQLERRMHTKTLRTNDIQEGIDAVLQIAIRLIPLWPMVPVLFVARLLGLGQKIYDFIARRRVILPSPSSCVDGQCLRAADTTRSTRDHG
jgi:predicted DCC family thiol-disulfide oxidoreductase YuxK